MELEEIATLSVSFIRENSLAYLMNDWLIELKICKKVCWKGIHGIFY